MNKVYFDPFTTAPDVHAKKYAPSSIGNIMACNAFKPHGGSSKYSAEGTACHGVAAVCLEMGGEAFDYVGMHYQVDEYEIELTPDLMRHVQSYVEHVHARADGNPILVEQKLPLINVTGEDAHGTADAVLLHDKSITIIDLKMGMGVRVEVEQNEQLMTYALAAIDAYENRIGKIEYVDLVIFQPRLNNISEWRVGREELEAFGVRLATMIDSIEHGRIKVSPGASQCRWCAKAATCEALSNATIEASGIDFDDLTKPAQFAPEIGNALLAKKLAAVDMLKAWIKAVEDEARKRMLSGQELPGHKLVEGRRGSRRWVDEHDVEELMRAMRIKHDLMFEKSLVSPTSLEKLFKRKVLGPRQWEKLKGLIVQPEGSPTIVTESDPRHALVIDPTAGLFADNS